MKCRFMNVAFLKFGDRLLGVGPATLRCGGGWAAMTFRKPLAVALGVLAGLALTTVPAAATPAPAPAPPLTGEHLGPDRLPRCADVVAAMSPRDALAQRLMVGVEATDPGAVAEN